MENLKKQILEKRDQLKLLKEELHLIDEKRKNIENKIRFKRTSLDNLERDYFCKKYNLELEKTVIHLDNEDYLLMDLSYNYAPIVKRRNKNGKWSKKSFSLGAFDFEKMERIRIQL